MIKNLLLSLIFLCSVSLAMAQGDKTVTGKVTDGETGESIPGVNVIVKGTTSGSVTDFNGDYNVTLPEGSNVLIYSYVGYTSEEIEVGSQTKIDVKLIPDITALSEIVVVGYGTQEKKEITSAVASISEPEDFNRGNVQDPAQLLQGKVAGLSISTPGGDPNATPVIRLRGLSTVGGNVEPLVVVDGVIGSSLENVDPNDIESIDVLKDGSAAAIYGTRASSGVIMVTTKSGKLRYAALYNPTAPIRFDNGEFYQAILFDNFNPVAIIDQNENKGINRELNYNLQAEFSIIDELSITANFGQQYGTRLNTEYYPASSFFRGLNRNSLGRRFTEDNRFTLFETYGTYTDEFGSVSLTVNAGYSFQENFVEQFTIEAGNFPTDALGFYGIFNSGDRAKGIQNDILFEGFATPDERIIAFFGRASLTIDDGIYLNASVRREGSTKLGPENQWGTFPAFGVGVDLNRYLSLGGVDLLKFRVGYGVTGALPGRSGQAQDLFVYSFDEGGIIRKDRDANPDLKWEEKAETNIGLEFAFLDSRLSGTMDYYIRNITDFILERDVPVDQFVSGRRFENVGALRTSGFELALNYDAFIGGDFNWTTGVVFSTYRTSLEEYINDQEVRANLGSPGQNATTTIRVAVGEEIGQIWGPRFAGVNEDGSPAFVDLNGDGVLVTDPGDALAENGDFEQLGSGLPDFEIGWTNQLTFKNWDLNAFFRGAFGHSLVNTYRAFYEPIDPGAINSYNRVITDKAVDGLTFAQFSSLYVEKADFFKLDNITLGYNFDMANSGAFDRIRAYFTVQNAFVITNYSGIDPEPVLQDFGSVDNGGRLDLGNPDVLSPGIDRRNNYFTARTFTLGLNVAF
jgi:TonB-dependent SusC/RagA subfamily outer membrane receptor